MPLSDLTISSVSTSPTMLRGSNASLLVLATLAACTGTPSEDSGQVLACAADSPAAGEVRVFASGLEHDGTNGSEGLVFSPDGRLFVGGAAYGGGGFVTEVDVDGTVAEMTPLVGSVGLEWWNDQLVVAVGKDGAAGEVGGVVLVDPSTWQTTVLTEEVTGANFPLVTPWDTLLVSAPGEDEIYEVTASGDTSLWLSDIPSPNGIVLRPDERSLYATQSYDEPVFVREVAVDEAHQAGAVTELVGLEAGATQDGVAMDADGNVYIVLNLPGEIIQVTPAGEVTRVASGVEFGASLAFGVAPFDPCSLYVTSLFSDALFQVGVDL